MTLVARSATIQVRVVPFVKSASEAILTRLGLNMTEAVELFLRRVIVDERIPFDVVALSASQFSILSDASLAGESEAVGDHVAHAAAAARRAKNRSQGGAPRKEFKTFLGARTSIKKQQQKRLKKSQK